MICIIVIKVGDKHKKIEDNHKNQRENGLAPFSHFLVSEYIIFYNMAYPQKLIVSP